jgi:hypothetical protein
VTWTRPRASTVERGYGHEHQTARERWAVRIATTGVCCARCGLPIIPGVDTWHLGHDDSDRDPSLCRPEHARCNLRAAAKKGARMVNRNRQAGAAEARGLRRVLGPL